MSGSARWALIISLAAHVAVMAAPMPFLDRAGERLTRFIKVRLMAGAETTAPTGMEARLDPLPGTESRTRETTVETGVPSRAAVTAAEAQSTAAPEEREAPPAPCRDQAQDGGREAGSSLEIAPDAGPPGGGKPIAPGTVVMLARTGDAGEAAADASDMAGQARATNRAAPVAPPPDRDYLEAIRQRIIAAMSYPPLARKRGWEGRVTVRFHLDVSGRPDSIEVLESSGMAMLDGASLKAVRDAAPFPPNEGWIILPIVFRLKS